MRTHRRDAGRPLSPASALALFPASAFALGAVMLLASMPAVADKGGSGVGRKKDKAEKPEKAEKADRVETPASRDHASGSGTNSGTSTGRSIGWSDERILRDWFRNSSNLSGLPPGLAKRESLPPGLQKQLIRNGTLPPGLQSKLHPLPDDLERRLPRLPDGIRRVVLDRDVLLVDDRSGRIKDIVRDVLAAVGDRR